MRLHALWNTESDPLDKSQPLVIRDVGHDRGHPTVTNDAEFVVAELVAKGLLPHGRALHYYDSSGALDQILVSGGKFYGFAPVLADGDA